MQFHAAALERPITRRLHLDDVRTAGQELQNVLTLSIADGRGDLGRLLILREKAHSGERRSFGGVADFPGQGCLRRL